MWEVESELNHLERWARDRDSRVSEVQSPLEVSQLNTNDFLDAIKEEFDRKWNK
jgi:hypothetical protein